MKTALNTKLYGAKRCHKTQYYKTTLNNLGVNFTFIDVEENETNAQELRNLYDNRKLNFPTITLNSKRLRNPSEKELIKQINKASITNNV